MIRKNIFSIVVALIIMYLSMSGTETFETVSRLNIPYLDKIAHFVLYFGLMSVIILENRRIIIGTGQLFLIALIPFFYGILIEILQATITETRSGSIYDIIADAAGILCSVFLWLWLKPRINAIIRL